METIPLPPRIHASAPHGGGSAASGGALGVGHRVHPHLPTAGPSAASHVMGGGALPISSAGSVNGGHSGQDDEALSSLLLLLRSNQSKDAPTTNVPIANVGNSKSGGDASFHDIASGGGRRLLGSGGLGGAADLVEVHPSNSSSSSNGSSAGGSISGNGGPTHASSNSSAAFRNPHFRQISMDDLRRYFHLPIVEVARQLGICTTLLKKVCRRMRIQRWPYRQIRSITKSVQSLEMACLNEGLLESERAKFHDQIKVLQNTLDLLIQDPNTPDGIEGVASLGDFVSAGAHLDLANHKPSSDVAAMLAAAAATASIENGESSSKRRKQLAAEEQRQHEEEMAAVAAAAEASSTPMVIGLTLSGHALVTQGGRQRLKFTAPVQLAPLERRKMRSQKKLVPLIEPDICNFVHVEFLARTMLRLKSDKLDASLLEVQQQLAAESAYANAVSAANAAAMDINNSFASSSGTSSVPMDTMGRPAAMQQGTGGMTDTGNSSLGSVGQYPAGGAYLT